MEREQLAVERVDFRAMDMLELGPFMWFGGAPEQPLPDISSYPNPRRATHNAEGKRSLRKNHHEHLPVGFAKLKS